MPKLDEKHDLTDEEVHALFTLIEGRGEKVKVNRKQFDRLLRSWSHMRSKYD